MRIRDSSIALATWRSLSYATGAADRSMARLSSGQRVNSAADDAASLGISQRLLGQVKGLVQANRNALDGVSLLHTAEGAMNEIHALLQRGRELSVQAANGTLTESDREVIQTEFDKLMIETDRISDTTTFNNKRLLNPTGNSSVVANTLAGLRGGWLEQAEQVIQTYYGLIGDGSPLEIILEASGTSAVTFEGDPDAGGMLTNLRLRINLAEFMDIGGADGGTGPVYHDRKIARELTKAVMARNGNFMSLDSWFVSGAADLIAGADEELAAAVAAYTAGGVVAALATPWTDDNLHRPAAYAAMKYLNEQLSLAGFSMADLMAQVSFGNSLDNALFNTVGYPDVSSFMTDFQMNGVAFLGGLNLADADVGGINPGDASAVIPNGGTFTTSPLANFTLNWPTGIQGAQPMTFQFQVGANEGEVIQLDLPEITTANLNLIGVDLVDDAQGAISRLDRAINQVSSARGKLGGVTNRLEHALNANSSGRENQQASFSLMVDLDIAKEMANLTRSQILVSAAEAASAHANSLREHVMALLGGIKRK